jgi:hypothetical protein
MSKRNEFDWLGSRSSTFFLQLPYLNVEGNPLAVEISSYGAEQLVVRAKTHYVHGSGGVFVVTPIVPPAVDVEYQAGSKRV